MIQSDYTITINGVDATALPESQAIYRAVIISLYTWRRANADDVTEGQKMGYWGDDALPSAPGDKIGSRLWLLSRAKLVNQTFNLAREYGEEALKWFVDDGIASKVVVTAERFGMDGLALVCKIFRTDGSEVVLTFNNAWEIIRAV